MTDKDREAFEAWATKAGYRLYDHRGFNKAAEDAWQAAAAHYAPKLTEEEAVQAAAKAIQNDSIQQVMPDAYCGLSDYDAKRYAVKALRAAEIRFKEEA